MQIGEYLDDSNHNSPVGWVYVYNMTILRIISFGMDKYWAHKDRKNNEA